MKTPGDDHVLYLLPFDGEFACTFDVHARAA